MQVKPSCSRGPKILKMPELWDMCWRELLAELNQPKKEKYVVHSKAEKGELSMCFDKNKQDLVIAFMCFDLAFAQCFLTMFPFWNGKNIFFPTVC